LQDDAELEAAIDAQMKKRLGEADDASEDEDSSEDAADGSTRKQRQGGQAADGEEGSEESEDEPEQQQKQHVVAGDRAAQLRAAAEAAVAAKRKGGSGAKAAAAPKARVSVGAKLVGDDNITCRIEPELQQCSIQVRSCRSRGMQTHCNRFRAQLLQHWMHRHNLSCVVLAMLYLVASDAVGHVLSGGV
jgi:hypothetical protein